MFPHRVVLMLAYAATCGFGLASASATPLNVTICDLIRNAKSYDGRLVNVRGHVAFAFEDFGITDSACDIDFSSAKTTEAPIWLTYGGDEQDPAVYCCGSHHRRKGTDLTIEGHTVPLIRDGAYREFRDRLEAQRLRRPEGSPCFDECKFYRVTASITGTFFAKGEAREPFSGYGHLGCCNLLVVQQVSNVSAERMGVPLGGEFECTSESWAPSREEEQTLKILRDCQPSTDGNCEAYLETALAQAAGHWKDEADQRKRGRLDRYGDVNGRLITEWIYLTCSPVILRDRRQREGTMPNVGRQ
jgi:hypothetical protein